ncbi:hypothetical protein [uncultured Phascolarctobacterium sp.]|uniref:hypothetical protein n=1 Tax=uncultured Phascolarctobacterium sp. TaxID=512296 RepID=UPI0025F625A9|nr:hypothetical protein [uncultured Phascolarctobacterium sp.]
MKEIGGYIELDTCRHAMLHEDSILLNCGRNALAYLLEAKGIKKLYLPYFLCDSVANVCKKYGVEVAFYHIGENWLPKDLVIDGDAWLYIVNFYGQITREDLARLAEVHNNVIIDNAQAYFDAPLANVDTLYTCRKFFGVSDGAILYTNSKLERSLEIDESFNRIHYVLGRYERTASEFYEEAARNNDIFDNEPIKEMSRLTKNLLRSIDYEYVKQVRTNNFAYLHEKLREVNKLNIRLIEGAFMYPLLIDDGMKIRKQLQQMKIYIPTLWPNVLEECKPDTLEYKFAAEILPIPVDQRYGFKDMEHLVNVINIFN